MSISISQKLLLFCVLALFFIGSVSLISTVQMSKIGTEIYDLAEYDMPLMRMVTQFTEDQLLMEISYEKAGSHGILWKGGAPEEEVFKKYAKNN